MTAIVLYLGVLLMVAGHRQWSNGAPSRVVMLFALLYVGFVAATKAMTCETGGAWEAAVLAAQPAVIVLLLTPQSRAERRVRRIIATPLVLIAVSGIALYFAAFADQSNLFEKKALRILTLCAPWAVAGIAANGLGLSSFRLAYWLALLASLSVFILQGEKTPVLGGLLFVAGCFCVGVQLEPVWRVVVKWSLVIILTGIAWQCVLETRGYTGIEDYFERRIVKSHLDEARVAGVLADGTRLTLWRESLDLMAASPIDGMALDAAVESKGYDEHNAFVFYMARTGLLGFPVLVAGVFLLYSLRREEGLSICIRSMAILPGLLYASVGNYFCDGDYLLAVALASRLAPPQYRGKSMYTSDSSRTTCTVAVCKPTRQ